MTVRSIRTYAIKMPGWAPARRKARIKTAARWQPAAVKLLRVSLRAGATLREWEVFVIMDGCS
jgi:hypothetical protein